MRGWLRIPVLSAGALVALLIALHRPAPASILGDVVGVRGSRPFSGFCRWQGRSTGLGAVPTGGVVCAWYRPERQLRRAELDQLSYQALSRRIHRAERSWEPLSEHVWRRDVDSIRVALRKQGGTRLCRRESRLSRGLREEEVWRFPEFDVELFTGRGVGSDPANAKADGLGWYLFLRGERDMGYLCKQLEVPITEQTAAADGESR